MFQLAVSFAQVSEYKTFAIIFFMEPDSYKKRESASREEFCIFWPKSEAKHEVLYSRDLVMLFFNSVFAGASGFRQILLQ